MAEPTTHNTLTDGPVTVDVAITFVPTTDATTGRELSDKEREQAADQIVSTAAQNDQWKKSLALPAVDHVQIAAQPVIQRPADEPEDEDDAAPQNTDGTGGTGQPDTPPAAPPAAPAATPTEAPATAPSQEPPPPPPAAPSGGAL